jgi:hypothetical protein
MAASSCLLAGGPEHGAAKGWQERILLFLKKKKQKDFIHWHRAYPRTRSKVGKFFGSFFQKRTCFPFP